MSRVIFPWLFLALCAVAALAPLLTDHRVVTSPAEGVPPDWPASFEGRPLQRVPLSPLEAQFKSGFPGEIARFTGGECEVLVRWVTRGTRKLHSSADCFRGLGYRIEPAPAMLDRRGLRWSCFKATRGGVHLRVRERIAATNGAQSWTDVSAWFWSAAFQKTRGPWIATTVIVRDP